MFRVGHMHLFKKVAAGSLTPAEAARLILPDKIRVTDVLLLTLLWVVVAVTHRRGQR